MELVIGTTNPAKARNIRAALDGDAYTLRDAGEVLSEIPEIPEDAGSVEEIALRKAIAFAAASGLPAVSLDYALFFDGVPNGEQPGVNVRRIPGGHSRPSDDDLLDHYTAFFSRLGGEVRGRWEIAVAAALPTGRSAQTKTEIRRRFVSLPSSSRLPGYPLASLQLVGDRYVAELAEGEEDRLSRDVLREPLRSVIEQLVG